MQKTEDIFRLLSETSNAFVSVDSTIALANLVVDLAKSGAGAENSFLLLVSDDGELLIHSARGPSAPPRDYKVRVGEGLLGTVASRRISVAVVDLHTDLRFRGIEPDRYVSGPFIACTLMNRGITLGVLCVSGRPDGGAFNDSDLERVSSLASHAAVALEDALLMKKLIAKAARLEEANRRLVDIDLEKTEFLARLSYDLRTPLNAIKGAIYYLRNSDRDKAGRLDFFDIISNETEKLISCVEGQLDSMVPEKAVRSGRKKILSLAELMDCDILDSGVIRDLLMKKNLRLKVDARPASCEIAGHKASVVQFFTYLIEGIGSYLEKDDSMEVALTEGSDCVEARLTASRRLPDTEIAHLFKQPLYSQKRIQKERLKLFMAGKIARAARWEIVCENRSGCLGVTVAMRKDEKEISEALVEAALGKFNDLMAELLCVDTCSIMLASESTGEFTIMTAKGLDEEIVRNASIRFGDSVAGWVALEGRPLLVNDIEKDPRFARKNISQYNTRSLLSVPLKVKGAVVGVINFNNKKSATTFTEEDLVLASALSDRLAHLIDRLRSGEYRYADLKRLLGSFDGILLAGKGYSERYGKKKGMFAETMSKIIERLGVSDEYKKDTAYISAVYDLGLMVVDHNILSKKTLNQSDVNVIKNHPRNSVELLDAFEFSDHIRKVILHHHERFDGKGYPSGLKGEDIPLLSRAVSAVDAFCGMTNKRPYGKVHSIKKALDEIKKRSGSVFDPMIVEALEGAVMHA